MLPNKLMFNETMSQNNLRKMKNKVLKFRLFFAVIILFGVTAFMSCEKKDIDEHSDLQNSEITKRELVENFSVTFKTNGKFLTNDDKFIKGNHRIEKALSILSSSILKKKSLGDVLFTISQEGRIITTDKCYNDKLFVDVLINEGKLKYFDQDFTVVFDNTGYKSISNEEIYLTYPQLKQYFSDAGEGFINQLPNNEKISIFFSGNKFFVNGKEFPLFSHLKGAHYDSFRACVGFYWFTPGLNVVFCGVGELIVWACE